MMCACVCIYPSSQAYCNNFSTCILPLQGKPSKSPGEGGSREQQQLDEEEEEAGEPEVRSGRESANLGGAGRGESLDRRP